MSTQAISHLNQSLMQQVSRVVGLLDIFLFGYPPVLRVSVPVSASLMPATSKIRNARIMEESTYGDY